MRVLTLVLGMAFLMSQGAASQQMQGMDHSDKSMKMEHSKKVTKAIAVLMSAPDSKVQGTVTFEQTDEGIKIVADVTGLTPGKHGFHIHEFGDCSAADFTSAGGHFMLQDEMHGSPSSPKSHKGDMGNIEADANGVAHLEFLDTVNSLNGPNSILGRGVIVHEKEDDLTTQPTGGAGARIACGTIGIVGQ